MQEEVQLSTEKRRALASNWRDSAPPQGLFLNTFYDCRYVTYLFVVSSESSMVNNAFYLISFYLANAQCFAANELLQQSKTRLQECDQSDVLESI